MRMRSATRARMFLAWAMPASKLTGMDAMATSEMVASTMSLRDEVAYVTACAASVIAQANRASGMRNATVRAGTLARTHRASSRPAMTSARAPPMMR